MLQLLVRPDSVFYVLLRESPPDDILNEPQRKPLSSLEDPVGKLLGPLPPRPRPYVWRTGGDAAGRPMRLKSRQALPIRSQELQRWPCQRHRTLIDHMQRESVDPVMALDDEDGERASEREEGAWKTIWMTLFVQGDPFSLAFCSSFYWYSGGWKCP